MSLLTSLVSYWKMDESSGTRVDAHGSNDLADINTVGNATGIINLGADFDRSNGEYLSIASNATLQMGDIDMTVAAWVNLESLNGAGEGRTIVAKFDVGGAGREYILAMQNSAGTGNVNRFFFGVSSDGTAFSLVLASTLGTPSTGTWYYVVGWHDATADKLYIQVNNGTVDEAAYSGGIYAGSADFNIGVLEGVSVPLAGFHMDGIVDEVGLWKRTLTTDERTDLYNSGAGLPYSAFSGGGGSPWNYYAQQS